jgi:hypothetical protein
MADAKSKAEERYVFLQERFERWNLWLEGTGFFIVVGFAVLVAAYSAHGFWSGFWDAINQFL